GAVAGQGLQAGGYLRQPDGFDRPAAGKASPRIAPRPPIPAHAQEKAAARAETPLQPRASVAKGNGLVRLLTSDCTGSSRPSFDHLEPRRSQLLQQRAGAEELIRRHCATLGDYVIAQRLGGEGAGQGGHALAVVAGAGRGTAADAVPVKHLSHDDGAGASEARESVAQPGEE